MPRFKDQAICIRHIDWSETSQIVALLTREHGQVRGLAKGSRRTSPGAVARFSGGIELLTRGQVVATTRPTAELASITEWDAQAAHPYLRRNLRCQNLAMYAADLTGAMVAALDPHPTTYDALETFLTDLANPAKADVALLVYQWTLLEDSGYRPQLDRDAHTDEPLSEQTTYAFDPIAGGLVTNATTVGDEHAAGPWRVRQKTVSTLRLAAAGPLGQVQANDVTRANRLLCVYARAILDRHLPTANFILKRNL